MRNLLLLLAMMLASCGGVEEPSPPSTAGSPAGAGCLFERGMKLPDNLQGDFRLKKILSYEEGQLTRTETPEEKTLWLNLTVGEGDTRVAVTNSFTDAATVAKGRVTVEGEKLAVRVDDSNIPLVFAGATYCLALRQEVASFTVILDITPRKSLQYEFSPLPR